MGNLRPALHVPDERHLTTVKRARQLRRSQTGCECRLWGALRKRRLEGIKFRRQHPIGPFIADFYSPALKLVIEVDGPTHEFTVAKDAARQYFIEQQGLRVLRFTADEVEMALAECLERIRAAVHVSAPLPQTPSSTSWRGGFSAG